MVFIEGALSSYLFDAEIYLDGIIKRQTVVSETFLNGPIPASFSFLSFQKLTMDMLKKFADDWIWATDLWYWKHPLCQLSHNQYFRNFVQ